MAAIFTGLAFFLLIFLTIAPASLRRIVFDGEIHSGQFLGINCYGHLCCHPLSRPRCCRLLTSYYSYAM